MATYVIEPPRTQWRRPDWPLSVNQQHPISRGLVLLQDDTGIEAVAGGTATVTGTRLRGSPSPLVGRTRGYGSSVGSGGTTDALTTRSVDVGSGTYSLAIWLWRNGAGGGNFGRVVSFGIDLTLYKLGASYQTADQSGAFTHAFTGPADASWGLIVVVIDASGSTSPTIYVNGVAVAVTGSNRTWPSGSGQWIVGNRSDGTRWWDGYLGPFLLWNRGLSASEVRSLYDPRTRWDLYQVPSRRVIFDVGAVVGGTSRVRPFRLGLLGVH